MSVCIYMSIYIYIYVRTHMLVLSFVVHVWVGYTPCERFFAI